MISEIFHLGLVAGLPPKKKVYRMPCDLPCDPHGAFFAAWTQVEYSATSKCLGPLRQLLVIPIPIGSMYTIYGNIYHQYTPNVSIYTIHGSYGIGFLDWMQPPGHRRSQERLRCLDGDASFGLFGLRRRCRRARVGLRFDTSAHHELKRTDQNHAESMDF